MFYADKIGDRLRIDSTVSPTNDFKNLVTSFAERQTNNS